MRLPGSARQHGLLVVGAIASAGSMTLALSSCGSSTTSSRTMSSGAGGGMGAGSSVASAAASTTTSTATSASSGSGGALPAPDFAPLAATPLGCPVDRVTNPGSSRAFSWRPCDDGTPACEELVFNGPQEAITVGLMATPSAQDDGIGPRIVLTYEYPNAIENYVLFTDDEGIVIDGYRSAETQDCTMWAGNVAQDRLGVLISNSKLPAPRVGGLLRSTSDQGPPTPFEVTPPPTGFGPQDHPMSASRWAWQYSPGKVFSVSAIDGGDLRTMVAAQQAPYTDVLDAHDVAGAGSLFLIPEAVQTDDAGNAQGIIYATDGLAQPTTYLRASDGSWYDYPTFAQSHVAWFRGIGFEDINQYMATEIWASPFSADPAALAPYKVDDYAIGNAVPMVGGWGRIALPSARNTSAWGEHYVYDLAHGTRATFTLPDGRILRQLIGLTKTHFYLVGELNPNAPDQKVVRFALGA